jgi:hypothetical protein
VINDIVQQDYVKRSLFYYLSEVAENTGVSLLWIRVIPNRKFGTLGCGGISDVIVPATKVQEFLVDQRRQNYAIYHSLSTIYLVVFGRTN